MFFPKYYFKHSSKKEGKSMPSLNELSRDGLYLCLTSTAGYAKNMPIGAIILFLSIKASKEQAKFPPAESPAKTMFFGRMLK